MSRVLPVFFDRCKTEQAGDVLEGLAEVAKRGAPVYAVFIGVNVALNFSGVDRRHDFGPSHHVVEVIPIFDAPFIHRHGPARVDQHLFGEHVELPHCHRLVGRI